MKLYLLRHGEAVQDNVDPRRPLTERGRADVESVCRRALARGLRVAEILHSGKLRAQETAEILARLAGLSRGVRETSALDPQADPLLAKAEIEASAEPVALVGHMPHLGRTVSLLVTGDADRRPQSMVPAGLVVLTKEESWRIAETIEPDAPPDFV